MSQQSGLILKTETQGQALLVLNEMGALAGVEVFEMIPTDGGTWLILKGPRGVFEKIALSSVRECTHLPEWSEAVEKAYLSLDFAAIEGHLFVVEGADVGGLFQLAGQALLRDFKILDFKISRGRRQEGGLFLTHADPQKPLIDSQSNLRWTSISNPRPLLRSLFDLSI